MADELQNREWALINRPDTMITVEDFELRSCEIPDLKDGEVRVRVTWFSVDPYLRYRIRSDFEIDAPFPSTAVGVVIDTASESISVGETVYGYFPWREIVTMPEEKCRVVDPAGDGISPSHYIGMLGIPGLSAYFASLNIGQPEDGETVFLTGAAGAVGTVAGQIFKLCGCRVVGCAGTDEKVQYLLDLGFDAAFNYKTMNIKGALNRYCPDGVDVYWDNVGGSMLDAVLLKMNEYGRIVLCGAISQYNIAVKERYGVSNLASAIAQQVKMEGFMLPRYKDRYPEGRAALLNWYKKGSIKAAETIREGFDNLPAAFCELFTGGNIGKMVVKLD